MILNHERRGQQGVLNGATHAIPIIVRLMTALRNMSTQLNASSFSSGKNPTAPDILG